MPIVAWYGIPPDETSVERYQELRASGANYTYMYYRSLESAEKALDAAAKTDVKLMVRCAELQSATEATVRRFMNHPGLAGYYIFDEPSTRDFPMVAELVRKVRSIDPKHFAYVNLLPNYATKQQLGIDSYREYVRAFIREVPVQWLSFDHYPILDTGVRDIWYENLEIFSAEARNAGKAFWAFALTVAHGPYPIPTLSQLRLQVFSNLAYGAQGIQYFTYCTPYEEGMNFRNGPITRDLKRSDVYYNMQAVNREIKDLSGVFLGAKVVSVAHTGASIPQGTVPLKSLPAPIKQLATKGTGAVVSVLKNGKTNYLVIVNRDFRQPMDLTIRCGPGVKQVRKNGTLVNVGTNIKTVNVSPGDIAIYMF
ncbi:hypothetical protein HGH92_03990 [Chitinophaga varians]|uniref:Glycoside hydrolase family 42 N-terminal domain-containing protein n=1 Tax=Chitinophaga varians TaxID=2202339 RepID=A0A847R8P1_9BACT|nr:hypothetical protein [Chitinophaga varians]